MCIQDWRLGRLITSVEKSAALVGPASVTIPRNQQRVLLIFSTRDAAIEITLGTEVDGAIQDFLNLSQEVTYFQIDARRHGDWVTHEFRISIALGNETVTWVEGYMPEDYLHVQPNYFDVPASMR